MRPPGLAIVATLTALALVAAGCSSDGDGDSTLQTPVPEAPFTSAPRVQSRAYQLQGEDGAKIADFCGRARTEGFIPLVTVRALDRVPQPCP